MRESRGKTTKSVESGRIKRESKQKQENEDDRNPAIWGSFHFHCIVRDYDVFNDVGQRRKTCDVVRGSGGRHGFDLVEFGCKTKSIKRSIKQVSQDIADV